MQGSNILSLSVDEVAAVLPGSKPANKDELLIDLFGDGTALANSTPSNKNVSFPDLFDDATGPFNNVYASGAHEQALSEHNILDTLANTLENAHRCSSSSSSSSTSRTTTFQPPPDGMWLGKNVVRQLMEAIIGARAPQPQPQVQQVQEFQAPPAICDIAMRLERLESIVDTLIVRQNAMCMDAAQQYQQQQEQQPMEPPQPQIPLPMPMMHTQPQPQPQKRKRGRPRKDPSLKGLPAQKKARVDGAGIGLPETLAPPPPVLHPDHYIHAQTQYIPMQPPSPLPAFDFDSGSTIESLLRNNFNPCDMENTWCTPSTFP